MLVFVSVATKTPFTYTFITLPRTVATKCVHIFVVRTALLDVKAYPLTPFFQTLNHASPLSEPCPNDISS